MTDPQRRTRRDPGNPDVCPVFAFHKAFSPATTVAQVDRECRRAGIGCRDCKGMMHEHLTAALGPHRERRAGLAGRDRYLDEVMAHGRDKAREIAAATLEEVRAAMGVSR